MTKIISGVLDAKYGEDWPKCIEEWNDMPERTFADIDWLLGECASHPDAPMVGA